MSNRTYRVTEIVGTSPEGIDQAVRNGVERAATTLPSLGRSISSALKSALMAGAKPMPLCSTRFRSTVQRSARSRSRRSWRESPSRESHRSSS